jgi:glutaredoxin
MKTKARLVLYTKKDCGLCNKMREQMALANCAELYTLEEVDIERDPELFARYRYEIPVLWINGAEAFRHRLTPEDFENSLRSYEPD